MRLPLFPQSYQSGQQGFLGENIQAHFLGWDNAFEFAQYEYGQAVNNLPLLRLAQPRAIVLWPIHAPQPLQ